MAAGRDMVLKLVMSLKDETSAGLGDISKSMTKLAKDILPALGAAASAAFILSIKGTVEWSNKLEKLSRELGVSTEEAAGLIDVADDLGVSAETLSTSLGILAKKLAGVEDAETSTSGSTKGFNQIIQELGITSKDYNVILPQLADHFKDMPNGIEKTALAMQLFGRGGKEMLPLLNMGGEAMRKATIDTQRFGLAMSGDAVKATRAFQIAQSNLGDAFMGVKVTLGTALMPLITPYIAKITEGVVVVGQFVEKHKDLAAVITTVGAALGVIMGAKAGASILGVLGMGGASTAITGALSGIGGALAGLAAAAAPFVVAFAAVTLVWNGVAMALGRKDFLITLDTFKRAFTNLGDAAGPVVDKLRDLLGLRSEIEKRGGILLPLVEHPGSIQLPIIGPQDMKKQIQAVLSRPDVDTFASDAGENTGNRYVNGIMAEWNDNKDALATKAKEMLSAGIAAGAAAFRAGIPALRSALEDLNKPLGSAPNGALDFAQKAQDLKELEQLIPEAEERIRRAMGTSTAKGLNDRVQDPNKIKALQNALADLNLRIAQNKQATGDMTAANASWGNTTSNRIQQVRDAFKAMVGDQITSLQMNGTISDDVAQAWRDATGVVQTKEAEIALNLKRTMDAAEKEGPDAQRFVSSQLSGILNTFTGNTDDLAARIKRFWEEAGRAYLAYKALLAGGTVGPTGAGANAGLPPGSPDPSTGRTTPIPSGGGGGRVIGDGVVININGDADYASVNRIRGTLRGLDLAIRLGAT